MKKILKSKGFLVTVLSVSCIAILIACLWVSRDTKTVFLPDEPPPDTAQENWTDTPKSVTESSSWNHTESSKHAQEDADGKLEEYPKVTEENEQEVVLDFIPAETKEESAPPSPPEGKTTMADPGEEHPLNPAPEADASSADTGTDGTPSAGSTNENGAVYDPVFGWVVPGQVNQSSIDSSGDPNKMVGNMGN